MNAFPEDPEHFLRWAQRQTANTAGTPAITAQAFVPRKLYGDYLQSLLHEADTAARPGIRLEKWIDEAMAIQAEDRGAKIYLKSGTTLTARWVVLALGNFPPGDPRVQGSSSFYQSPRYISHPWSPDALAALAPETPVLLIGAGLTMADLVLALQEQGHRGVIHVVSRRGLWPQAHRSILPYFPFLNGEQASPSLRSLVRRVRKEIRLAATWGNDWRAVIDTLRPQTQRLWRALSLEEQRRFLRHVRPYWEIHRHRMAPEIATRVERLLASGQLVPHAGTIHAYHEDGNGMDVIIRKRCSDAQETLRVGRVVNCTGPECDYRKLRQPLLMSLLEQGLARPDPLFLGLDVSPEGALLDAQGQPSPWIYTLGPPQKGLLWETTAVPELRVQAAVLARILRAKVERAARGYPAAERPYIPGTF
jgi:uncharacterized NAD(P)/FAD-binding protein YdhS